MTVDLQSVVAGVGAASARLSNTRFLRGASYGKATPTATLRAFIELSSNVSGSTDPSASLSGSWKFVGVSHGTATVYGNLGQVGVDYLVGRSNGRALARAGSGIVGPIPDPAFRVVSTFVHPKVEISFTSALNHRFADEVWTDVTDRVRSIAERRGRQNPTARMEAGTISLVLSDHEDRRFDPNNRNSPYWPHVVPMRKIRISATRSGLSYPVFSGYVDAWNQRWKGPTESYVEVTATDAFKILAGITLPTSVYAWEVSRDHPLDWFRMGDKQMPTMISSATELITGGSVDNPHPGELAPRDRHGLYEPADGVSVGLQASSLTFRDSDGAVGFSGIVDSTATDFKKKSGDRAHIDHVAPSYAYSPRTTEFLIKCGVQQDANSQDAPADVHLFAADNVAKWPGGPGVKGGAIGEYVMVASPAQLGTTWPVTQHLVHNGNFEHGLDHWTVLSGNWTTSAGGLNGSKAALETSGHGVLRSTKHIVRSGEPLSAVAYFSGSGTINLILEGQNVPTQVVSAGGGGWAPTNVGATIGDGYTLAWVELEVNGGGYVDGCDFTRVSADFTGSLIVMEITPTGLRGVATNDFVDDDFAHHVIIRRPCATRPGSGPPPPPEGGYAFTEIWLDGEKFSTIIFEDDPLETQISKQLTGTVFVAGPPPGGEHVYLRGTLDEIAGYQDYTFTTPGGFSDFGDSFESITESAVGWLPEDRIWAHYQAAFLPWDNDTSGQRVSHVLEVIEWPEDADIDVGDSTLGPAVLQEADPLTYIQNIANTEHGIFFITKEGTARFRSRSSPYTTPYLQSKGTFFDATGQDAKQYMELVVGYDDRQIYNDVRVTRDGGHMQQVQDIPSMQRYLRHTLNLSGLMLRTDQESLALAKFLLALYREPKFQILEMVFIANAMPDELFPQVLERELGDRITVQRQPPGGGDPIIEDVFIEAIEHQLVPGPENPIWKTKWKLSLAGGVRAPIVFGDPRSTWGRNIWWHG